MYKEQVKKMGEESQQQQEQKGDAPTCGICHKTKFADGCGHNCSYCQTKFCARCGGRVSLRSNKVRNVYKEYHGGFILTLLDAISNFLLNQPTGGKCHIIPGYIPSYEWF